MTAASGGLALLWFALTLAGLGMFCFDGALFRDFNDRTSFAPDCFVVHVNVWINPKRWLLGNLACAMALGLWSCVAAYGLFRARPWGRMVSLAGTAFGIFYFAELAIALPEFRTVGIFSIAVLACLPLGCFAAPRLSITVRA
jgi:hypothetical protein